MKTGKKLIPILCCIGIAHFCSAQQVEWKYTTNSDRWQNEHNVTVSKAQNQVKYDVLITSYKEQTIDVSTNWAGMRLIFSTLRKNRKY